MGKSHIRERKELATVTISCKKLNQSTSIKPFMKKFITFSKIANSPMIEVNFFCHHAQGCYEHLLGKTIFEYYAL